MREWLRRGNWDQVILQDVASYIRVRTLKPLEFLGVFLLFLMTSKWCDASDFIILKKKNNCLHCFSLHFINAGGSVVSDFIWLELITSGRAELLFVINRSFKWISNVLLNCHTDKKLKKECCKTTLWLAIVFYYMWGQYWWCELSTIH